MKDEKSIPIESIPRDMIRINDYTGNTYLSVVVLGKRANQLANKEKEELTQKLADFAPKTDTLEEYFDNREQMEISAHYEKKPKSTLVALDELMDDNVYYRNPNEDIVSEEEVKENNLEWR